MVIPMFKEDYKNKSIKELVKERQKLIKRMIKYENTYIFETKEGDKEEIIVCPSPEVIWSVNNENLIMLTQLIEEKRQEEFISSLNKKN